MVWRSLAIMLIIAGVNALDQHSAKVWKFARDYGVLVWHLLDQAETRMRVEEFPRIRRELMKEAEAIKKTGGTHSYDPKRPWALVWQRATGPESDRFWQDEFSTPATLARLHLNHMGEGSIRGRSDGRQHLRRRESCEADCCDQFWRQLSSGPAYE